MRALPAPTRRASGVLLAAVIGVCLLGTTGCDPGKPAAATVDGHQISQATLQADLEAEEPAGAGDQLVTGLRGQGQDTFAMDQATQKLTARIRDQVVTRYLAEQDIKVTAKDRAAGEEQICSASQDPTTCQTNFQKYPKAFRDYYIGFQAKIVAATNAFDASTYEPKARAAYDQAVSQGLPEADEICFDIGQFPDQASADQAKALVQNGTDLATAIAANPAAQPGQGEQCTPYLLLSNPSTGAPQELLDGKTGDVLTVADPSGVVVLVKITKRDQAKYADLKPSLISALQQQEAQGSSSGGLQAEILKTAKRADVTVNPQFGTWDPATLSVVPPKLPKGSVTTTAPSNNPAGSSTTGG